jgi:hypothetical protein
MFTLCVTTSRITFCVLWTKQKMTCVGNEPAAARGRNKVGVWEEQLSRIFSMFGYIIGAQVITAMYGPFLTPYNILVYNSN